MSGNSTCVVDYKSGKVDVRHMNELEDQLIFYCGLWHETRGTMPSLGRIEFLVDRTHHELAIDPVRVEALMANAKDRARVIDRPGSLSDAHVGEHCTLCEYRPWCGAYWRDHSSLGINVERDVAGELCREHPRDSKAFCIKSAEGHTGVVNRSRAPLPPWRSGTKIRVLDLVGVGVTRFRADWTEIFRVV